MIVRKACKNRKGVRRRFAPRAAGACLGGIGTFGVVACVQEVTVTCGGLPADADPIHYIMGASKKDEEEAIRTAANFSTTARRQTVVWSGLPCEARFWDWKLEPAKGHTTCRGWPIQANPAYRIFWTVFGATCLRLQRLASWVGFGTTAELRPRKNLPVFGSSL